MSTSTVAFNYSHNSEPMSPVKAAEGADETVTMIFPRSVMLTRQDRQRVFYTEGVHEVPVDLADHSWLAANGAKPYTAPVMTAKPTRPPAVMTDLHVKFFAYRGYPVTSVADAQARFANFTDENKADFLMDVSTDPDFSKYLAHETNKAIAANTASLVAQTPVSTGVTSTVPLEGGEDSSVVGE